MKKTIFLTLLTVMFAGSANAADPNLHMPLDSSPDDVIVSLTGTVTGDALTYDTGKLNNAAVMNGTNMISYDYTLASSTFSAAMWVNPANVGIGWRGMLDMKDDDYGEDRRIIWIGNSPTGVVQAQVFPTGLYESNVTVYGTTTLANGTWMHIVYTHDGTTAKIYVNGALKDETAASGDLAYLGPDLTVGGEPGRVWGGGSIDDVKIYDGYAIDYAEVAALYTSYMGSDLPPMIDTQPVGGAVDVGDPFSFTVEATNPYTGDSSGLEYLWYKDSVTTGITTANLDITSAVLGDTGDYYSEVTITSNSQMVASDTVGLLVTEPPEPNELILHMPMDGDPDDDIVPISGTPTGGVTYSRGQSGQAVNLDGVDGAPTGGTKIEYNYTLSSSVFSVAMWVKPQDISWWRAIMYMQGVEQDLTTSSFMIGQVKDGPAVFHVFPDGTAASRVSVETTGAVLTEGTWTHIVCTHDGTNMKVYIDGALDNEGAAGGALSYLGPQLRLGEEWCDTFERCWNGSIDDVKVFNYVLEAGDVTAMYDTYMLHLPPEITAQPVGGTVDEGDPYTGLVVVAANPYEGGSTTGLEYLWYKGSASTGVTTANLDITTAVPGDAGDYYCEVTITSNGEMVASDTVTLVVIPGPQMILHMPLNDSPDDIIVPLTGTVTGDALTYSAGKLDNAAIMNGTNMISYDYTLASSTFSAALWVNPANVSVGWRGMMDMRDAAYGEDRRIMWIGNSPAGVVQAGFYPDGASAVNLVGTTTLANGTWMHIIFTHDGTTANLYINGQPEASLAASGALAYLGPDLTVGGEPGRVWGGGAIDEVRVYNFVVDDFDAEYLYAGEVCVTPPALDLDGDCTVGLGELAALAAAWLEDGLSSDFPHLE